ncbi:hypothetical protein [Streptosporangium sp. NPDC051022]|uniref:hypothetical protein n=1 Tax=Streptosporangium sp. NPDC051022 TaxID=3155752 RepID=UPI00341DDAC0
MAAVFLGVQFLVAGCGLFYGTSRVDPAVLDEVRGIGRVLGEATVEGDYGAGAEVTDMLVIDVGGANGQEAADRADALLLEREWTVVARMPPHGTQMRSTIWDGVYLDFHPFYPEEDKSYPDEIAKVIEASAKPETLLIVSLDQT